MEDVYIHFHGNSSDKVKRFGVEVFAADLPDSIVHCSPCDGLASHPGCTFTFTLCPLLPRMGSRSACDPDQDTLLEESMQQNFWSIILIGFQLNKH